MTVHSNKARRETIISRLAERMRADAETGMPDRVMRQVNFRSLAVSAYLEIEAELRPSDG